MSHKEPIDFFDEPKASSLNKLDLLKKYLSPWAYKLLSRWDQIWIVDAFAGAGAYNRTADGIKQDGSPLVAAKWAAELARSRGGVQLRCINTEANRSCFEALRNNLAPWQHVAANIHGEFSEELDSILEQVKSDPTFFFLDPFGVRGIEMNVIDKIRERGGDHNELLIHFSDRSFQRMAGNAKDRDRSAVGAKVSEAKASRIDRVMGTRLWRGWWSGDQPDGEAFDKLVELYLAQLRSRGFPYVAQVRIRDGFAERTRYRLIFATRSAHGFVLMSDIAASYERRLYEHHLNGQGDLLADLDGRIRLATLADEIHKLGIEKGSRATPFDLMAELVPMRFGEHRKSDYMKAIRELVRGGEVDRPDAVGIQEFETLTFVPRLQGQLI